MSRFLVGKIHLLTNRIINIVTFEMQTKGLWKRGIDFAQGVSNREDKFTLDMEEKRHWRAGAREIGMLKVFS